MPERARFYNKAFSFKGKISNEFFHGSKKKQIFVNP
jgi:hypothetical protein